MSFLTATQVETIYAMPAPASAWANTATTKTVISANSTTNPAFQLPALTSIWEPSYMVGRAFRVCARGVFTTSASPTTITASCQLDPAQNSVTGAVTLAATGALTPPASITNGNWELEFDVSISALGMSGGFYEATLQSHGLLSVGAGNNAATGASAVYTVGAANISFGGSSTINPATPSFLELWATWGATSPSGSSVTCTQFFVFGLN
jgi:hypothetical protein